MSPDYQIGINRDLLTEIDGPMLKHGLQETHGRPLALPVRKREWPDKDRLATRWRAFSEAG